jgi:surface protein
LKNIKSNYILKLIYFNKIYSPIEIIIIPVNKKYGKFINNSNENGNFFHIFFNDNKKEIKRNYIEQNDKVSKIRIKIDYQIMSFEKLFYKCDCIKSINFTKFYRTNINNMKYMFYGCSSLTELNLSNFFTNSITNMSYMFFRCSSLKELNLSNFNTDKVSNMSFMFCGCLLITKLNLSNFNLTKIKDLSCTFYKCSSLDELNFPNLDNNDEIDMNFMFYGCNENLKKIIKKNIKNIKDEALY